MCDPISIASLAIGAVGKIADSAGAASAAKKQEREYAAWAADQKRFRAAENARQEDLRGKAEVSRQQGVEDISADAQKAAQTAEEARLTSLMAGETQQPTADPAAPTSAADATLTGQTGGGEVFQTDLAKKIADATASARQRIGALARVQSYGDSFGGLGTVNPINQGEAGAGIDAANTKRRGSLSAYGSETGIDPLAISYKPGPLSDIASVALSLGGQGLGSSLAGGEGLTGGLGKMFAKRLAPKVTASSFIGAAKPLPSYLAKTGGLF